MEEAFTYLPLTTAIRTLGVVLVVLLMMIFAIIYMSRKRGERIERKIDAIGEALGIGEHFAHLDEEHGRRSTYASMDHQHDPSGWEGGSSRHFSPPVTRRPDVPMMGRPAQDKHIRAAPVPWTQTSPPPPPRPK